MGGLRISPPRGNWLKASPAAHEEAEDELAEPELAEPVAAEPEIAEPEAQAPAQEAPSAGAPEEDWPAEDVADEQGADGYRPDEDPPAEDPPGRGRSRTAGPARQAPPVPGPRPSSWSGAPPAPGRPWWSGRSAARASTGPAATGGSTSGSSRAVTGPGGPDMERRDRARVLLPIHGPRLIVVLGCTVGAGQSVTTLMLADVLANLRGGAGRGARPQPGADLPQRPGPYLPGGHRARPAGRVRAHRAGPAGPGAPGPHRARLRSRRRASARR